MFAVVVIWWCFMIGVNVWWVYLALQNVPRAIVADWYMAIMVYCTADLGRGLQYSTPLSPKEQQRNGFLPALSWSSPCHCLAIGFRHSAPSHRNVDKLSLVRLFKDRVAGWLYTVWFDNRSPDRQIVARATSGQCWQETVSLLFFLPPVSLKKSTVCPSLFIFINIFFFVCAHSFLNDVFHSLLSGIDKPGGMVEDTSDQHNIS